MPETWEHVTSARVCVAGACVRQVHWRVRHVHVKVHAHLHVHAGPNVSLVSELSGDVGSFGDWAGGGGERHDMGSDTVITNMSAFQKLLWSFYMSVPRFQPPGEILNINLRGYGLKSPQPHHT